MTSLPTISQYEQEAENNNNLAFEAINSAFPSLFQEDTLAILLTVQRYLDKIRDSEFGRIIIHKNGEKFNVEFRGNSEPLRDS